MKGKTAMAEILTLMQKAPKHPGLRRFSICSIYVIRIVRLLSYDIRRNKAVIFVNRKRHVRHADNTAVSDVLFGFFQNGKRAQQFAIRLARFFDLHRMQNAVLFRDEIDLFHVLIPVEIEIDLPLLFDVKMKLTIF